MKNLIAFVFVAAAMAGGGAGQAQESGSCNRECLESIADQYLAAMVQHDASRAPLAEDLVFTENTVKLPPTEGLWFTASGLRDFKFYI